MRERGGHDVVALRDVSQAAQRLTSDATAQGDSAVEFDDVDTAYVFMSFRPGGSMSLTGGLGTLNVAARSAR